MNRKLFLADDDKTFHRLISRVFAGTGWDVSTAEDGVSALRQITAQPPDVILLDLNMPLLGGRELLARLRKDARLAMIPVIILSGNDSPFEKAAEFGLGADDFISKPFSALDLVSRVESACRRTRRMLGANPLTFLPGGPAIEEEAAARIRSGAKLAFFYIDIDNFKSFNDNYGYLNGDNAIKQAAALLTGIQAEFPEENVFVGHIGGDDFALMCEPARAEELARAIAARFDALAPRLYNQEDRRRGFLISKDRMGKTRQFPLITLSIAIATNERRELDHYAKIVDIASEIKKHLKGLKDRSGSAYLKDRRLDQPLQ
jgi:diguanylate cyclase (GGDEF)-like protein